ncbi:Ornithine decarboxylase antizyme [Sergentomyia squamirostris]
MPSIMKNLEPLFSSSSSKSAGTPDVPTSRTDHDKASFSADCNRKTSLDSTSSSEYSDIDYMDTTLDYDNDDYDDILKRILNKQHPVRISLKLFVTENTYSIWDTILDRSRSILYVALPSLLLPAASKQSFISLLEFAEEKLKCNSVILCMQKDREDRANLVRTFLFLGFQPLAPKSDLIPPQAANDNNLFMIYNINEE